MAKEKAAVPISEKDQKDFAKFLQDYKKQQQAAKKSNSEIKDISAEILKSETARLALVEKMRRANSAILDLQKNILDAESKGEDLSVDILKGMLDRVKTQKTLYKQGRDAFAQQQDSLKEQLKFNKALEAASDKADELVEKYEGITEAFEEADEFVKKLPGGELLSKFLGTDKVGDKIKESVTKRLTEGQMAGKGLVASLGPLIPLLIAAGLLMKAFEFDKELTQFSKDLDVSKGSALEASNHADHLATNLGMANITGKEMGASMVALKEEFGDIALTNDKLVEGVTMLRERMGLTNEEALSLNSTATLLGTNLDELSASSMKMSEGLIGGKQMLKEMAKLPKSLVAGFKGTTQQLQKAIVKGKLFGLTIEQAQKAGEGMLQIEESLQKEMTFNILAGKNMNLNKARQLALEGKTAELQDEILSQAGSLEDYQKMGPLQQKAMAEALNMSKDELTEMLTKTQEMADVGLSQAAVEEQMKLSLEDQQSTIDGMNDEKKKAYLQDLLNKKKQEEATAKFADSMTKLTEAFQKTMMPVVELLGEALGYVGDIIHYFTVGIEKLNHWIHSLTGAKEELKEGEGVMSSILKWAMKIGGAILLWNVGKKALGGLKSMIPGMGGGKTAEAASSATGSADQVKGATQGKNKVSQILDGIKNIIDSIKGVVQSAIQFVKDVGKDLINTVKDLFNGVVDLVRSVGTNVLSTLQELIGGIGKILADGTDIIVNVGSKLAEGAMKILNIIIEGLGKAAGQLPAIMSALGSAVVAFFTPMAALVPLAPAIAIFTLAMIGLGYAFKLLGEGIGAAAPGIEAFFNGMGTVIESVGTAISKVIETITTSIIRLQDIDPLRLMGVAGGIVSVGAAIAGFGAGAGAGGIMAGIGKFFDEDPVEKFNRFATIDSAKLIEVASAIDKLGNAIANFSSQVGKIGEVSGIIETIDKVMELHDAVTENPIEEAISGVAEAVGGIFSKAASFVTSSAPEASSVTTSAGAAPAASGAAVSQGSLKEVADLLKQILSATSQPVSINIGGKVIDEIGKQTTLRKTYSTKIDTAHGAFG